jgi:dockerin type I repeat protein
MLDLSLMKTFFEKHLGKLATGQGILVLIILCAGVVTLTFKGENILALLASATSSLSTAPAILYFTPYDSKTLQVGAMTSVDININALVPINAVGITIKFPQDMIEIVGVSKAKSFLNLWTEDTAIKEDTGEVHFSGGTTMKGGLTGSSTALTLTIEAKEPGQATLSFETVQVYASDGTGTSLTARTRSITFTIPATTTSTTASTASASASGSGGASGATLTASAAPTPPSADLNGDGVVNLVDVSIMAIHILAPYDPRYDLNDDGSVNLSDLSILFSKMGSSR